MKTSKLTIATAFIFALTISATKAQEVSVIRLIPDKQGETSREAINEIEKDFNEVKPIEKALSGIARLPIRWTLTEDQLSQLGDGVRPQTIEVVIEKKNGEQIAYYNSKGEMTSMKESDINAPLPDFANTTLKAQYADWQVLGNKEFISSDAKATDYYKVQVANGKTKKYIFFDLSGNELDKHLKPINKEGFAAN